MKISYDHFKKCRPQNKSLKTFLKGNDFRYKQDQKSEKKSNINVLLIQFYDAVVLWWCCATILQCYSAAVLYNFRVIVQ